MSAMSPLFKPIGADLRFGEDRVAFNFELAQSIHFAFDDRNRYAGIRRLTRSRATAGSGNRYDDARRSMRGSP